MSAPRHLGIAALAAIVWALYQGLVGAAVARFVPGGPLVAVAVSIVAAIGLGIVLDLVLARVTRPRT
ncbi:hypothetical protein Q9S36_39165 [Microbacterium sp. ARD31]|uniref:hypothetical protein n=1 Tax=Microbacterium sp. ARD31 TaxID=2962576 RepID=UPI002882C50E|nr:hypothetical protein [Microbacterium sp. ARD31]MDT0186225.1 hypothetical protein [Microbacterium sp. ARD31]